MPPKKSRQARTTAPLYSYPRNESGHLILGDVQDRELTLGDLAEASRQLHEFNNKTPPAAIRSKKQVIIYSRLIIAAMQEALDYDPRNTNLPPPVLRVEDQSYLTDIQSLVVELRRLNDLLSKTKGTLRGRNNATIVETKRHLNTFLNAYAKTLGKGAGYLTVAAFASLLYQMGGAETLFDKFLGSKSH